MADFEEPIEAPPVVVEFDTERLSGLDALADLEQSLGNFPSEVDFVVAAEPQAPIGRSWAYDWVLRRFDRPQGSRSPQGTRGVETVTQWIEKCLRTGRGAHPVNQDGYGLEGGFDMIGADVGEIPADFETRIREALLFHPRITDVHDFQFGSDPINEYLSVAFSVTLDDDSVVPFTLPTAVL